MIYVSLVRYWSLNQYIVVKKTTTQFCTNVSISFQICTGGLETALVDMYLLMSVKYTNTNVVAGMILHRYILIRIDKKYVQGDQGQHQDLRRQALWQRRQASTKP